MTARESFIESLDKTRIWYSYIKGKKETLVFLHGLTGSSSAWNFVFPFFEKEGYSILMMDIRGHGLSEKPEDQKKYSIKRIAEDLFLILKKEKIKKMIIVSHCYGTFVAQEFYSRHKEYVNKIVLISSNINFKGDWQIFFGARIVYFFYYLISFILWPLGFEKNQYHLDYRRFEKSKDFDLARIYGDIKSTSFRVFFPLYRELISLDFTDIMKKIDIPVLIIHGKRDLAFPVRSAYKINSIIKNSELEVLEAGHLPIFSSYKEIIERLNRFLKQGH